MFVITNLDSMGVRYHEIRFRTDVDRVELERRVFREGSDVAVESETALAVSRPAGSSGEWEGEAFFKDMEARGNLRIVFTDLISGTITNEGMDLADL